MPPDGPLPDVLATSAVPPAGRVAAYPYHVGDTVLPGYRLVGLLGRGGFGEVWRADAPGGMGVAIKVLANLGRREGSREYRALQTIKNIRHAHIVPVFGVWLKSADGRVLEETEVAAAEQRILAGPSATPAAPADGLEALELVVAMGLGDQTLSDRLREAKAAGRDAVPVGDLLPWMHQAALALDHFNSGQRRGEGGRQAVQHCDIKPQNILLVGDAVQVCDFGLARVQGDVRATSNTMASLAYAAPEMVVPPYDPSPATDQYSLAVTYVELRTGRLPYEDPSPMAIMRAKAAGRLPLGDLPAAETAVLNRALEVPAANRWPSCVAFIEALRAAVSAADVPVVSADRSSPSRGADPGLPAVPLAERRPGSSPWTSRPVVAGGAVAAGAVALAVWFGVSGGPAGKPVPVPVTPPAGVREQPDSDRRAAELWNLQEAAAAAGRKRECLPVLEELAALYASARPPRNPDLSRRDVLVNLAWYRATLPGIPPQQVTEAVGQARTAVELAGDDAVVRSQALDTLAAALARAGRFTEAVVESERAIAAAPDDASRADFTRHRDAFVRNEPWVDP